MSQPTEAHRVRNCCDVCGESVYLFRDKGQLYSSHSRDYRIEEQGADYGRTVHVKTLRFIPE